MSKSKAITINFLNEKDKIETQNLFRSINKKTGEINPVVLNKALRLYLQFSSDKKNIEKICHMKEEFKKMKKEFIEYLQGI